MLTNINQKQIFLQIESKNLSYTELNPRMLLKILHSGIFIFCSRKSGRDCVFITFYGLSVTLPSRFFCLGCFFCWRLVDCGAVVALQLASWKHVPPLFGQWLWHSWQSGYFPHQKSSVRIPTSAKFYL